MSRYGTTWSGWRRRRPLQSPPEEVSAAFFDKGPPRTTPWAARDSNVPASGRIRASARWSKRQARPVAAPDIGRQQVQRGCHFGFAGWLKADSQEYRKRRADQRDGRDAVVILKALADFAVHLPFYLPLQARVTTARAGATDLDAIDGGDHAPPGPLGTEGAVSLQAFGYRAAQLKYRLGVLTLHGVAEGIFGQWSDPHAKDAGMALELDAMRRRQPAGRSQEHGVEHFSARMERVGSALGQSAGVSTFSTRVCALMPSSSRRASLVRARFEAPLGALENSPGRKPCGTGPETRQPRRGVRRPFVPGDG